MMASLSRRHLLITGVLLMEPVPPVVAKAGNEPFTLVRLPFDALRPNALWEVPEAVRIVANAPASREALTAAFIASDAVPVPQFPTTALLSVVSSGPVLDSPDVVRLRDLNRAAHRLVLRIDFTRIRMTDVTLPRSVPWRPLLLVAVPAGLPAGSYEVLAVWHALSAIPGGRSLPVHDLLQACHFDIVG